MTAATLTPPHIVVQALRTDADLIRAQQRMETLWGAAPGTPEGDELDILADLVEAYEQRHHPVPDTGGVGALRALLDGNDLTQSELPEVGNQSVVSQILSGRRQLNVRQIRALAARFNVPPSTFL
jgi:HTH-type transcriptional regulator/antitoxin HigA